MRNWDNHELPVLLLYNLDPAWEPAEQDAALAATDELISALRGVGHPVTPVRVDDLDLRRMLSPYDPARFIVLNWCEAIPGIARSEAFAAEVLEEMGFTYSGSPPAILKASEDKQAIKKALLDAGVPTPAGRLFERPEAGKWTSYPAIVKPVNEHCSIGIEPDAVVLDEPALLARVAHVLETYLQPALVEDFIDGREFRVTLWGNDPPEVLPPVEMEYAGFSDVRERLCSWDAKFTPGSRHYTDIRTVAPAPLEADELKRIKDVSLAAYRTLKIRDYARLDIRLRRGTFYILDPNPNPDISADASLALTAELAGYSYGLMGSRLVRLAAERHPVFGSR